MLFSSLYGWLAFLYVLYLFFLVRIAFYWKKLDFLDFCLILYFDSSLIDRINKLTTLLKFLFCIFILFLIVINFSFILNDFVNSFTSSCMDRGDDYEPTVGERRAAAIARINIRVENERISHLYDNTNVYVQTYQNSLVFRPADQNFVDNIVNNAIAIHKNGSIPREIVGILPRDTLENEYFELLSNQRITSQALEYRTSLEKIHLSLDEECLKRETVVNRVAVKQSISNKNMIFDNGEIKGPVIFIPVSFE